MELSAVGSTRLLELESPRSCLNVHHLVSLRHHCRPPIPPSSCPARLGARLAAGDAGHGAREGIPGRSCAGRGRGSEAGGGAHTHTGARARAPGGPAPTRPAGKAQELAAGEAAAAACPAAAESGCFPSRGAAVAAWGRNVARAAPRRPWTAFKGRRGPAREPGTGRGPGWSAASCSACPAPRPLEGGGRLGREGRACPGCGVREGGVLWALLDRRMGGTGVVRACQVTGACDIPAPPCSQPPAARPGAGWTVRPRSMEDWVMESVFHSWRILSENPSKEEFRASRYALLLSPGMSLWAL